MTQMVGWLAAERPSNMLVYLVSYFLIYPVVWDRLVGLVVKASASRAEGPGFESRWRRDFFGVESYQ